MDVMEAAMQICYNEKHFYYIIIIYRIVFKNVYFIFFCKASMFNDAASKHGHFSNAAIA